MVTNRESVRLLCKSIINRLENGKAISFPPRLRQIVQDELFHLVGPSILTDQDLRERALAKVGAKAEQLNDTQFTDSEQFKAARAIVRTSFGDDELNGFYFQRSVKALGQAVAEYLMRSSHIDDVYETDDDLEKQVVDVIKHFDLSAVH